METVSDKSAQEPEVHLLTDWGTLGDGRRSREAGIASVLVHGVLIVVLLTLPRSILAPPHVERHLLTPLIAPLTELTQKAPNRGPITKEFNAVEAQPRPRIHIPASPPPQPVAARPKPAPAVPPPQPRPAPPMPEPPKIQAQMQPPRIEAPPVTPPPQIQAQEKPKLAFENPTPPPPVAGAPTGRVPIPGSSVQDAIRGAARGGSAGGLTVGELPSGSGIGEAVVLPPVQGSQRSSLELMSDPMGVDFRPYLSRILALVRRNWFAVWPESAKMGRSGKVVIQFAIARNGAVPKLVIVQHSGADALDRAAVAGISATNPFPPLPTDYKGGEIRLQFNFSYNVPR